MAANLLRCLLKDADEFLSDDFALGLRFAGAGQFVVIPLRRIHQDEVQIELPVFSEDRRHLSRLVLSQQSVVHEDTGQLIADGF